MSLSKIPVLMIGSMYIWKALTPPHTPPPRERLPSTFIGQFAVKLSSFMKIAHFLSCLCESILIISSHYSDAPISQIALSMLIRPHSNGAAAISITRTFLLGSTLAMAGAELRLTCYRLLGNFFTFEMAIRTNHTLVTSGPYRYVRHPAYTGLIMTMLGEAVIQFEKGSWLQECGWVETVWFKVYFVALIVPMALMLSSITMRRIPNEDQALRDHFGDVWLQWEKKTPYKVVPFVH